MPQKVSDAVKAEAVAYALEHGDQAAAAQFKVFVGTVAKWRRATYNRKYRNQTVVPFNVHQEEPAVAVRKSPDWERRYRELEEQFEKLSDDLEITRKILMVVGRAL